MRTRLAHFLLAELLAFGAFVCGGLALVGGAVTWNGDSRHSVWASWSLVALFAAAGTCFGWLAAIRFKRALLRTR